MSFWKKRSNDGSSDASLDVGSIYRRHITMVRGRALRLLKETAAAEDVAQEVFIRFIEHRDKGGSELETAAFLYRMTTNLSLNRIRDQKTRSALLKQHAQPSSAVEANEEQLALRAALCQVGEEEAQIAVYYYVDGMEQEEIADLLSMQRRTAGRRLERFRAEAARLLDIKSSEETK